MNKLESPIADNSNDLAANRRRDAFNKMVDKRKQYMSAILRRASEASHKRGLPIGIVGLPRPKSELFDDQEDDLSTVDNGEKIDNEKEKDNQSEVNSEQKDQTTEDIVSLIQKNANEFEEIFKITGEQQDLESAQYWQSLTEEIKTPEGRERVNDFVSNLIINQTQLLEEVHDLDVSIALRESINNKKKIQALLKTAITEKPLTPEKEMPTDSRGLFRYFVTNFKDIYSIEDNNQFLAKFTPEICQNYLDWFKLKIAAMIREIPEGARYPDTAASVLGNGGYELKMFQGVMALKDGHISNITDEFLKTPFSKLAKQYLDWDVGDDYFKAFSKRD
ncbi:MAG TPA: hypothetical protein PKK28_01580 [bacterium]|nr:hypothetical protein [bacterium]HNZ51355.1 hypothetical protein [bacterium]HOH85178.1 hypothetical protein [bacterium]HQB76682.1 hypothetical protein [bacterium]